MERLINSGEANLQQGFVEKCLILWQQGIDIGLETPEIDPKLMAKTFRLIGDVYMNNELYVLAGHYY